MRYSRKSEWVSVFLPKKGRKFPGRAERLKMFFSTPLRSVRFLFQHPGVSGGCVFFFNTLGCQGGAFSFSTPWGVRGVRFLFQHPGVSGGCVFFFNTLGCQGGAEKTSPAFLPFFEGHFFPWGKRTLPQRH